VENCNWPKDAQIKITDEEGSLFCESNDRAFDLSDNLMEFFDGSLLVAIFNLSRGERELWTCDYLKEIENLIEYDLSFDGYKVDIERLSQVNISCDEEYFWKLSIDIENDEL
jgi:hypothetical protein